MENNSKKQRKVRPQKDTAIITGNPNDIVIVSPQDNPKKYQTEQNIIEKVVGLLQRRKRAVQMRRSENKLQRRREMLKTRIASKEKIMQRAMRMAKQILRSRLAGRQRANQYSKMNVAQKISIDKMVEPKSKMIKKIAMRLLPRVQAGERVRLKSVLSGKSTKGAYNVQGINAGDQIILRSKLLGEISSKDFNSFFEMYEASIGKSLVSIATSPIRAVGMIGKGAMKTAGVAALMSKPSTAVATTSAGLYSLSKSLSDVGKVDTKSSSDKPKKSTISSSFVFDSGDYLFEKVCCCLRKKAEKYDMEYEMVKEVFEDGLSDYTYSEKNTPYQFAMQRVNSFLANEAKRPGLWANIHAKRERIKSGSGERMRKPGSEGAPTKQNFIDAAEETVVELNQMTLARYASKVREKLAAGKVSPDKEEKRRAGMKHAQMKLKTGQYNEAAEKKTPQEKFKAGLKKAGYDPDAGAKRLLDLIAKQKKEREEREAKYKEMSEEDQLNEYGDTAKGQKMLTKIQKRAVDRLVSKKADTDPKYAKKNSDTAKRAWERFTNIDESFVVDRAAGYSTTYTAADLGIKFQGGFALHPSVTEEGGAGDIGTDKLTNKYKKDTPGQQVEAMIRMIRAKRKANTPC